MTFERWQTLMQQFNLNVNELTYKSIINKYNENNLAYHNIEHIEYCLNQLDSISIKIESKKEIELAIWFHDIVYNPYGKDNELKSAEMAMEFLVSNNQDDSTVSLVYDLIIATKHSNKAKNPQEQIIMDIDISIFGESSAKYINYSKNIRKEYSLVPLFIYTSKRKEILNSFLSHERLFQSDYFFEKYENNARLNIIEEIKTL